MNTVTKTDLVTDIDVAGTILHWVPTTRWTVRTDEATAHLDVIEHTAITRYHGDRRTVGVLLDSLIAMGYDFDVDEGDQSLAWMVGHDCHVWSVPGEVVIDTCHAAMRKYASA
jgi:hypothetical protein